MSEVKSIKSRPNSIEFSKESNGNKRNSAEIGKKGNKSRPNSMEINGGVNNTQNNKRNSKEMKKSTSQDMQKINGGKKQEDAKKDAATAKGDEKVQAVPLAEEEDVAQVSASPSTETPAHSSPKKEVEKVSPAAAVAVEDQLAEPNQRTPEKETNPDSVQVEINKTATTPEGDQQSQAAEDQKSELLANSTREENSQEDEKTKEGEENSEKNPSVGGEGEGESKEAVTVAEKKSPTEAGSINEQRESGGSTVTATVSSANGGTTVVPEATVSSTTATTTAVVVASPPTKTPKYEIIAVRERHGLFRKAVPVMPIVAAVIFCLLNVIAPGIGTLCAGFTVLCGCPTEHDNRPKALLYNIVAAILQLITAPIVIGWVWSIMWGVTFVNVSVTKGVDDTIVTAHV